MVRAHMWYNLTATQGNQAGLANMGGVAEKMSEADVDEVLSRARQWLIPHRKE